MKIENTRHIETRLIFVAIVVVIFAIQSYVFIDGSQRSCLGNPSVLPYVFIGMPSLVVMAVLDIIFLAIVKRVNIAKIIANALIALLVFLSIFLFSY